jgi:hypothetical protein
MHQKLRCSLALGLAQELKVQELSSDKPEVKNRSHARHRQQSCIFFQSSSVSGLRAPFCEGCTYSRSTTRYKIHRGEVQRIDLSEKCTQRVGGCNQKKNRHNNIGYKRESSQWTKQTKNY